MDVQYLDLKTKKQNDRKIDKYTNDIQNGVFPEVNHTGHQSASGASQSSHSVESL